jgi:hypothetical protein
LSVPPKCVIGYKAALLETFLQFRDFMFVRSKGNVYGPGRPMWWEFLEVSRIGRVKDEKDASFDPKKGELALLELKAFKPKDPFVEPSNLS